VKLSPETIDRYVLQDQPSGGALYQHLRHPSKRYRKRYGSHDDRGKIPDSVDIAERPAVVDARSRLGDWEADWVMGKAHQGASVTLAERRSRVY